MFLMMYKCDCCIHIILHKCKYWQWSLWRRIDVWWGWSQYDISPMHNVSQVLVHRWLTHGWWWAQVSPPLQWSSPTTTGAHLTSPGHTYTQCTHCFHRIFMSSTLLGNISPFQSFLKICAAASFISIMLDFCSSTQKLTFIFTILQPGLISRI